MKKFLLSVVILVATAGMVFAGPQAEEAAGGEWKLNEPGKYPVVLGDTPYQIDVVAMYHGHENTGDLPEAEFTAYLEDLTNVHVNWLELVDTDSWAERQNLLLASGDLPDTILAPFEMSAQQLYTYGLNGTFIALNDLIDTKMPALKAELEEYPDHAAQLRMPDGNIYALPQLEAGCFHCTMSVKMHVYQPWLKKLGFDSPQTTDELYKFLVAIRDGDPNGNGKADEIPMMGAAAGDWNGNPMKFLMNSFIYTEVANFLERNNGRVRFVAKTDEWRDGLT